MISVTILTGNSVPVEAGIPFQLLTADDQIAAVASTDNAGVVTFDVDPASLGQVSIRLDTAAMDKMQEAPDTSADTD